MKEAHNYEEEFIPAMDLARKHNGEVLIVSLAKGYSREMRDKFKFFVLGKNALMENCFR